MISVMPGRRRAEEFAALVDDRAQRTPSRDAALLRLVRELRSVPGPAPRPEYVASLRDRLMAEADTALAAGTDGRLLLPARTGRDRRVAVVAGAVALVGATSSMAIAAQSALPGDALYPIKRALESAETSLQVDDTQRAEQVLSHAWGRLAEASALARMESAESRAALPQTLADFSAQADRGADLVLEQYADTGDETVVEELQDFVARSMDTLVSLEDSVPPSSEDALDDAARVLADIDARARAACPTCAGAVLEIPESLLLSFRPADAGTTLAPSRVLRSPSPREGRTTRGGGSTEPVAEQSAPDSDMELAPPRLEVDGDTKDDPAPEDDAPTRTRSPLEDLADTLTSDGSKDTDTSSSTELLDPLRKTVGSTGDLLEP